MACEVPLPSSPKPDDNFRLRVEMKNEHLKECCCTSTQVIEVATRTPLSVVACKIPAPPSLEPVDDICIGNEIKNQYQKESRTSPEEGEIALLMAQPLSVKTCEVLLPPSHQADETSNGKNSERTLSGDPSPPRPPPADATLRTKRTQKRKHLNIMETQSLDEDISRSDSNKLSIELPPSQPPAVTRHAGNTEKKNIPVRNMKSPSTHEKCLLTSSQHLAKPLLSCKDTEPNKKDPPSLLPQKILVPSCKASSGAPHYVKNTQDKEDSDKILLWMTRTSQILHR